MIHVRHVAQPFRSRRYVALIAEALDLAEFTEVRAAFAYATTAGVDDFLSAYRELCGEAWAGIRKQWLIGIDWCRTEPYALDRLSGIMSSEVRIPFGREVVKRRGCTPAVPFHPKVVILKGEAALAAIAGSGNMSRSGLTRGHEFGSVVLVKTPTGRGEEAIWNDLKGLMNWFGQLWRSASPIRAVRAKYGQAYESAESLKLATPTDDDAANTETVKVSPQRRRSLDPRRLRQLRAAHSLWIEAGNLHKNRGKDKPGNQLMMSPMTRVFFGFPASDLAPDTRVGEIAIRFARHTRTDCSLRFSNNSMDVLTLPVPGAGGPLAYDRKTLLFRRQADGRFMLTLAGRADKADWRRRSATKEASYKMTSGRRWGVF